MEVWTGLTPGRGIGATRMPNGEDYSEAIKQIKRTQAAFNAWDDLRILPGAFEFAGPSDPTLQDWQPGGAGATFKVYKFKKDDEVFFTCQMPHNYLEGSDVYSHIHWTPCGNGVDEIGKQVSWKIDYSWANDDAVFPQSTTLSLADTCSGVDDLHEHSIDYSISGTGKLLSSMLVIRLYRDTTGDTWVGATDALSPAILEFDLHYQIDSNGSSEMWSK